MSGNKFFAMTTLMALFVVGCGGGSNNNSAQTPACGPNSVWSNGSCVPNNLSATCQGTCPAGQIQTAAGCLPPGGSCGVCQGFNGSCVDAVPSANIANSGNCQGSCASGQVITSSGCMPQSNSMVSCPACSMAIGNSCVPSGGPGMGSGFGNSGFYGNSYPPGYFPGNYYSGYFYYRGW